MRAALFLAVVAGLLLAAGCQQTTVQGPGNQKLTVMAPKMVTLQRNHEQSVQVRIQRQEFTGPVMVSLSDLPAGVTADEMTKSTDADSVTFLLKASSSADMVKNHKAMINVTGQSMKASQTLMITVQQ